MRYISMIAAVSSILCAFVLSGCVEIDEDIRINEDGTGQIKVEISVYRDEVIGYPTSVEDTIEDTRKQMREEMEEKQKNLKKAAYVSDVDIQRYYGENIDHFVYDVTVNDFSALNAVFKEIIRDHMGDMEWKINITRARNRNMLFQQTFASQEEDEKRKDLTASALSSKDPNEKYYTVKLHASRIISSNGKISKDGKSVEWKIAMKSFESDIPYEIKLEALIPRYAVSLGLILGLIAVFVLILGGVVTVVYRQKKQSSGDSAAKKKGNRDHKHRPKGIRH